MRINLNNAGKIMDSATNVYTLPTLEEFLILMEEEDSELEKVEPIHNAYTVYNVYSSGPC